MTLEHSRQLKLAEGISGVQRANLEQQLDATTAVVSIDNSMPLASLTAQALLTTLRRGPGTLILLADGIAPQLITEIEEATAEIDPRRPLKVIRPSEPAPAGAIRVHVGPTASYRCIRIVPEGYGAHVASAVSAAIRLRRRGNPLGAVYAAALGAAEVFKHSAKVVTSRRVLQRHLQFCPVMLTQDLSAAPDLRTDLTLDLGLIGVGAIGTGIVLLLSALPAQGRLVAVDRERFARENVGTYSLGGISDVGRSTRKVDLAARSLRRFDVIPVHKHVGDMIRAVDDGELPWPAVVLTALDSPDARRDAQRLWPDRLIDAATGDTMLGLHDHRHGVDPCMWCVFPVNRTSPSGADMVAERLGISPEVLADGDAVLTEDHLKGKTEEQQKVLRPHLGTPMCGLARATGLSNIGTDDFMPSVPFVSLQAACLSVGRLIAAHLGMTPRANLVQYDGLFGPQVATLELMRRREDCRCWIRSSTIEKVREARKNSSSQSGREFLQTHADGYWNNNLLAL